MNPTHNSSASTSPVTNKALIKKAAHLATYCAGYLRDLESKRTGWEIFYAIDADIVGLYLDPSTHKHYAGVFDKGDALLARLIGDFLLLEFSESGSPEELGALLIIPPHDDEISRMLLGITDKIIKSTEIVGSRLDDLWSQRCDTSGKQGNQQIANWMIDNAQDLIAIFDSKSGPALELSRFAKLADDRLVNIESYIVRTHDWAFPLPNRTDELPDLESFSGLVEKWRCRLHKHRSPKQSKKNVDEDALVLGTLQWVNQKLELAAEKKRVLLVTGTPGIWAAAKEENHNISSDINHSKDFSDAYIRHPLAFLADQYFFFRKSENSPEPAFKLVDWLNLVFPNVLRVSDTGVLVADVSELPGGNRSNALDSTGKRGVQTGTPAPKHDVKSILSEWETQIRAAAVVRRVNIQESEWTDRAKKLLDWMHEKTDAGWSVEQLRSAINRRAVESLSALYSSTVWISLWSRLRPLKEQARGIPALRFEHKYAKAQEYCRLMIDAVRWNGDGSHQNKLDLQSIHQNLSKDDPTHYQSHVMHALTYATKGHWYATRAMRIADNLPDQSRGYIRGREAAYLLAIAERRIARLVGDLVTARNCLDEAKRRQNPDEPFDVRFLSEAFAQDTAEFNFQFFVDNAGVSEEYRRSLFETGLRLLSSLDSEPLPEVQDWVGQQVVTNVLSAGMAIYSQGSPQTSPIASDIGKVLERVERCDRLRKAITTDGVANFVYTAALAIFSRNAQERKDANARLVTLFFPAPRPFDPAREKLFKALALKANAFPV